MENYSKTNNQDETNESPLIEKLCAFLRNNQPQMQYLDLRRYSEMLSAKTQLESILTDEGTQTNLSVRLEPQFQYGVLTTELDEWTVSTTEEWKKAIRLTDGYEVYPLTNGRIRVAFLFRRMMKAIG